MAFPSPRRFDLEPAPAKFSEPKPSRGVHIAKKVRIETRREEMDMGDWVFKK